MHFCRSCEAHRYELRCYRGCQYWEILHIASESIAPSANIFVAFCSDMPLICSNTLLGLDVSQHCIPCTLCTVFHWEAYVYATDSTVLKPPSTTSLISRADNPATPFNAISDNEEIAMPLNIPPRPTKGWARLVLPHYLHTLIASHLLRRHSW